MGTTLASLAVVTPVDRVSVALVVDDQEVSARLRRLLALDHLELLEVNGVEALAAADRQAGQPDVIVVRLGRTRTQIVQAFELARSCFASTPIIGLWPEAQRRDDRRALKTGIAGLLEEDQIDAALVATIEAVRAGIVCFPRRTTAADQRQDLSAREKQVLGMLIMGFTNAEIGRRLYLAESTVKSHLSSAYMKLGVRSRKDAAALILDPDVGLGTAILALEAE